MNLEEESAKRQQFRDILICMAQYQYTPKDKREKANMYKQLEALYCPSNSSAQYRHFYTDIFGVFSQFESGELAGTAEIVCLNLEAIRRGYRVMNCDASGHPIDISENLKKLYDHASLEMARLNYAKRNNRNSDSEAIENEFRRQVNSFKPRFQELSDSMAVKIEESTKNAKRDYIAILGIFAAVLMAFFSGVGFSSSVLANIHQASIYRVAIGIIVMGTILFDIIWTLLEFIKELVTKEERNWRPFYAVNVVSVVLIFIVYLAWTNMRMYWWHFPWIDP